MNPWYYQGKPLEIMPEGYEGFIYKITLPDGRYYIGQKKFEFKRTKTTKGKRTRVTVESDWKEYFGSNIEVQNLVKELGPKDFHREILYLCPYKAIMNYCEALLILSSGSLLSDKFMNKWVSMKINASTVVGKIQHDSVLPDIQVLSEPKKKRTKRGSATS